MMRNLREVMQPTYDDNIIDEICPNPDNMTYEELIELQNKIGYVSKGLTYEQLKVIVNYIENSYYPI